MKSSFKYLLVIIFILTINFKNIFCDDGDPLQFIESLRQKIRRLEAEGKIKRNYEPYIEPELQDEETYDFIIVGGGSAGSALVHRLSEIQDWKILLLEAGGEPDILSDIPLWSPLLHLTENNWNYLTEKQENFGLGLEDQKMYWPRGKILGGSSQLNFMVYSRGAKEDYDRWANMGNPGWSYEDLLPFFKKLETCKLNHADWEVRGTEGPISVEDSFRSKVADVFIEAGKHAGYQYLDYNGQNHLGVSYVQATTSKGFRCSGERCYIRPIKNRKNLTIRLHSKVTKLLIKNKTAYGVEFEKNGRIYKANTRREIILSGGVINSAQILLLSGIGPKNQLSKFGIETIQDLPVGQKLYDHPAFVGLGYTTDANLIPDWKEALEDAAFIELYNNGSGILTSIVQAESLAFAKTALSQDSIADVEIILFSTHFCENFDIGLAKNVHISREIYEEICPMYEGMPKFFIGVFLLYPESYGYLELASPSYTDPPKIYPEFFTDCEGKDVKTIITGIREAMRIVGSPPFEKYGTKLMDKPLSGCKDFVFDSDDYWECALRHLGVSVYHHSTTCKMGPASDPESVVDNRLRVYGIKGLRVADIGIMPFQIAGHTNIPAFMIGEKAAHMIKEENLNN
ncbi:glucose-methanol-choline gmc oxidoreductase [Holotrichia oblita]|uniref:Glucose-methanol-choline gmc oxidoreductase n=1 Tax=Holotrichia oblita TaxID=644536 RepID=A0ACB9SI85_HOLOL|nr:glucose-methanol-choline gmc oxidoreductase [Holotrichia oblita]